MAKAGLIRHTNYFYHNMAYSFTILLWFSLIVGPKLFEQVP
jgi:hypothetical protein